MDTAAGKTKIAILGGGMAGLTTAFELTRTQSLRDTYDVTIYQMGWRLGGKCATGRGVHGRIEEHGIHGFSGSYYNALGLMRDCYDELPEATRNGEKTSVGVLASFKDAFDPNDRVVMWEVVNGRLLSWPFFVAPNSLTAAKYEESMAIVSDIVGSLIRAFGDAPFWSRANEFGRLFGLLHRAGLLGSIWKTFVRWFDPAAGKGALRHRIRRLILFLNYFYSMKRGIFDSKTNVIKNGFDSIDHLDYRTWLANHGANKDTLDSSLAYNTIDLSYAYPKGDTTARPAMGAGTYLRWTLRMYLNLGSFLWSFRAGTGETIIAPLYHVLKHRGVKFAFFNKVTELCLSDNRRSVSAVKLDLQATLKNPEEEYNPLIRYKNLLCWPSRPKSELLLDDERCQDGDLESNWSTRNASQAQRLKILERGKDFDTVVFAISVGAVRSLCKEILSGDDEHSTRWNNMVNAVQTCPTQTMQIWLTKESGLLGARQTAGGDGDAQLPVLSGTFVQPFNGQVDFTNLIKYENWPEHRPPKALWYFSGAMSEELSNGLMDQGYPTRQTDRVKHQAIQYLQATVGYLLPWASATWSPMGLNFNLLYTIDDNTDGVSRFESQFWRANIDPSERYVLAPAGSTNHRLEAGGSGFDNLILAGDWIYNGLNVGSFEGAVMGGKLAAHAISGAPHLDSIFGYRARAIQEADGVRPAAG